MISYTAAAALGVFGWTFAEYILHRFDGHGMKGRTVFSQQHLAHHVDPHHFAPLSIKVALAACVLGGLGILFVPLLGGPGFAVVVGFTVGWLGYEWLHRRLHTHGPLNAYGRWARRHHFYHHFNDASTNHGVTTSLWDWLFGTLAPTSVVRVPRKKAPAWLIEKDELVAAFTGDYVLRGRSR